jgi:hypothetical protein
MPYDVQNISIKLEKKKFRESKKDSSNNVHAMCD